MLSLSHILLSLAYTSIAATAFYAYFQWFRQKVTCFAGKHFLTLSVILSVPAALHILWGFGHLVPTNQDVQFVSSFFAIVIAFIFLLLTYKWTGSKNLIYLGLIFSMFLAGAFVAGSGLSNHILAVTFSISIVIFLELYASASHFVKMGSIFGSLYGLISLLFTAGDWIGLSVPLFAWFFPLIFLALAIWLMYLDGKYCMELHPNIRLLKFHHRIMPQVIFARYLLFTLLIAGLMFISTISIHELGHIAASSAASCEHARIVFELSSFPHTEIICNAGPALLAFITLAGLITTSIISILLMQTSEPFAKILAKLILAYGFLVSYADFSDLGLSSNVSAVISLLSLLGLIFAYISLSRYYLSSQHLLAKPHKPSNRKKLNHHAAVTNIFIMCK